ncbi:MAG: NADH-quinone oxidoreductase subunit M [Fibrobacteria bacterium]|nr:NADH-quinone oxidoreductase subunit M [Fibrobacteria bacterium]
MDAIILSVFFAVPLLGAALLGLLPNRDSLLRKVSIVLSLPILGVALALLALAVTRQDAGFLLRERIPLVPSLGIAWHVGIDGLSAALLALSGLIQFAAAMVSAPQGRSKLYHILVQLLFLGVHGTFLLLDAVFFYVFWEVMLVPMFFLIAIWGGAERKAAAVKFFVYTMGGSVPLLLAFFLLHFSVPSQGLMVMVRPAEVREQMAIGSQGEVMLYDLPVLRVDAEGNPTPFAAARMGDASLPDLYVPLARSFDLLHWKLLAPWWSQATVFGMALMPLAFWMMFVAFAVKIPAFPLHAWLPHAHVQAPTAISVVLAGILLKLGVYGLLRVVWPLFPGQVIDSATLLAALGAVAIVWGGFAALGQSDLKRLVAYSSISHMGFCTLGLAAANTQGLSGAAFQCVSHGLSASLLFLLVGALYERAHHRRVDGFGGITQIMPRFGAIFLFAAMLGAGLPGLAGFVGELSVLLGGWANPATQWAAFASASGVVLSAGYLLWTVQRVLYGPVRHEEHRSFKDLSSAELFATVPMVALSLLLGLWPSVLQNALGPVSASLSAHLGWVVGLR